MLTTKDATRNWVINDIAIRIVNSYLIAIALFLDVFHLGNAHLANGVVHIQVKSLLHFFLHFIGIEQSVNQFCRNIILRIVESDETIGVFIQLVDTNLAALAHRLTYVCPQTVDICLCLFAVRLAHLVCREAFGSALVFAHFDNLKADAKLSEQVL